MQSRVMMEMQVVSAVAVFNAPHKKMICITLRYTYLSYNNHNYFSTRLITI